MPIFGSSFFAKKRARVLKTTKFNYFIPSGVREYAKTYMKNEDIYLHDEIGRPLEMREKKEEDGNNFVCLLFYRFLLEGVPKLNA